MEENRILIREIRVSEDAVIRNYDTENRIVSELSYLDGRFLVVKSYERSPKGEKLCDEFVKKFKTKQDVLDYLRIRGAGKVSLSKIVEDIKKYKVLAEETIEENSDPRTVKSRIGRKNSAKEKLKVLYRDYKKQLQNKMALLLVTGSKAKEFIDIAEAEGNMISTSADSFYEDLTSRIPETLLKGSERPALLIDILSRHLEDKAGELDIASYPALIYKSKYSQNIDSREKMLALTKALINAEVGSELVGYDVLEQATLKAVNEMFDGKVLPVVVLLKDDTIVDEVVKGLKFVGTVTTVLAGEGKTPKGSSKMADVTTEQVFSVLKKMQKQISSKSKGE